MNLKIYRIITLNVQSKCEWLSNYVVWGRIRQERREKERKNYRNKSQHNTH